MKAAAISVAGALVVSAIGAIVGASWTSGKVDAATEVRVHQVEKRLDEHGGEIREMSRMRVLLERIDQRGTDMDRRLERVEQKLDAPARRTR